MLRHHHVHDPSATVHYYNDKQNRNKPSELIQALSMLKERPTTCPHALSQYLRAFYDWPPQECDNDSRKSALLLTVVFGV